MTDTSCVFKCEVLNYALRKTKDGLVVSFLIHPSDIPDVLLTMPIGQRFGIIGAPLVADDEIGPAETPTKGGTLPPEQPQEGQAPGTKPHPPFATTDAARLAIVREPKPEKTPGEKAVQLAGMLCNDRAFQDWLGISRAPHIDRTMSAAEWLRRDLGIKSRTQIATDDRVRHKFLAIYDEFRAQTGRVAELRS